MVGGCVFNRKAAEVSQRIIGFKEILDKDLIYNKVQV